MSRHLLSIEPFDMNGFRFPGYMVSSTAPINVEDKDETTIDRDPSEVLKEIADYLQQHEDAEILIAIHGYNSSQSGARWWYEEIRRYVNQNFANHVSPGLMVIGYRWSSENVFPNESGQKSSSILKVLQGTIKAFKALPKPLAIAGIFGVLLAVIGGIFNLVIALFNLVDSLTILIASSLALTLSLSIVVVILTIFILRISGYFRDTYRAANFGVSDLVEFIRQLDNQLVGQSTNRQKRVRLSFIGHSMGAFVVTNTVRILSDVFDRDSIGNLHIKNQKKLPSSDIGNAFRLSRLVLVAPDISAEAIISGRGNPLKSSLRRFDEAYLFSNEGDMVLKIASTAANYFSFPTSTRDGGYRLGNVIVRSPGKFGLEKSGIVNLDNSGQLIPLCGIEFLERLYLREGMPLSKRQEQIDLESDRFIAELFTYFDCTNYQENGRGIVSQALGKSFLNFKDYVALILSGADGHGGFLFAKDANFSRRLIYGLSSIGLEKLLMTIDANQGDHQVLLKLFSQQCGEKGIQVLLANERYDRLGLASGKLSDRKAF
ncbi:alpha/beta hydrolase [Leptolyngbya sp. DQ-M1]|uniref:alpha/beta hydrolase n=1 Tax=Leptolyngbya sp. DQ-M1 TaxID=2933920 RepID=UPI00329A677B